MKHLIYAILTFCFMVILVCHYTPLHNPVALGDAWHYRQMAMGFTVPQPFVDRIALPTVVGFLSSNVDISSWTYGRIENVDAWYFVVTFMCLWLTVQLVRWSMLRLCKSEEAATLAGFLYLSTFWLTGYQLANFWLQDPFVNLCIWTGIYLWTHKWYYGVTGLLLATVVKGGVLGYNWAVISSAAKFVEDIPQMIFAFGFLWITIVLAKGKDYRMLALLSLLFVVGRVVTADVARAAVSVFSFPILLGVATLVDKYKLAPWVMGLILLAHLWQQAYWILSP